MNIFTILLTAKDDTSTALVVKGPVDHSPIVFYYIIY